MKTRRSAATCGTKLRHRHAQFPAQSNCRQRGDNIPRNASLPKPPKPGMLSWATRLIHRMNRQATRRSNLWPLGHMKGT